MHLHYIHFSETFSLTDSNYFQLVSCNRISYRRMLKMKRDIRIIMPEHSLTYKYIAQSGYDICYPYYGNRLLFRVLREICFRLPFKWAKLFWFNRKNKEVGKDVILYANLVIPEYVEWLKYHNQKFKIYLVYENLSNSKNRPDKIGHGLCEKWTCDKYEAKKYGINLYTGGGYFRQWEIKKVQPIYDVFYVGKDKNRLQSLQQIEKELNGYGLKTFFYITWERGWQKKNDGIHKPFLPYEHVLDYIGKTKAILHLIEGAQNGITLRIQESLIHKVKLITNDMSIVDYDFYNPNNIFILGKDNMSNLRDFLNSPYIDVDTCFFKYAYFDQMIDVIVSNDTKIEEVYMSMEN